MIASMSTPDAAIPALALISLGKQKKPRLGGRMQERIFTVEAQPKNPRLFCWVDHKPTSHQAKADRIARAINRAEARAMLLSSGDLRDAVAVDMASRGYGVTAIYDATGISRIVLRQLVLGEV